jgi:hypothetical protein
MATSRSPIGASVPRPAEVGPVRRAAGHRAANRRRRVQVVLALGHLRCHIFDVSPECDGG